MKRTAPIISSHSSQTQIREIRNPGPGQPPASLLGYVLLSLLIITGATASLAQEKIRVGISNFSSSYAPIFVAKKRRFYSDVGVEIILLRGLLGTQALIGDSVDFASASNPNASVKGARLKILMVFNDKVQHVLIAQPGIRAVEELRGKRIAVSSLGSLDHNWLVELLPKFGLDPSRDVTFLVVGSTAERFVAMKAGSIDATLVSPPANFLAHEAGFPTLVRVADLIEWTVIERTKRLMQVTRDVRPEEIFDFSYLRRAALEIDRTGWKP